MELFITLLWTYCVVPVIFGYVVSNDKEYPGGYGYGVIIDAGSSGSKLMIYKWKHPWTLHTLPDINLIYSTKVGFYITVHLSDGNKYLLVNV